MTDEMLYKYVPIAAEELLKQYKNCNNMPFQPSQSFEKRMKRLLRQSHYPKLHFKYMHNVGRVAAIIVLCIALAVATTFSLKAAQEIKIRLKDQVYHDGYVEQHYSVSGEGEVKYFTYVPEGYEEEYTNRSDTGYIQEYVNKQGHVIAVMVTKVTDGMTFVSNTDFTSEYDINIECEMETVVCHVGIRESGMVSYIWYMDGVMYDVSSNGLTDEEISEMILSLE